MESNNERVIDRRVGFADGTTRLLSEMWRDKPLLLIFLRHLG